MQNLANKTNSDYFENPLKRSFANPRKSLILSLKTPLAYANWEPAYHVSIFSAKQGETVSFLLIELNEFSLPLLHSTVKTEDLPNIKKALNFKRTHLNIDDQYDSGFLEPWVQWVSIHTGTPSQTHQIRHLGDVANLEMEQIWELLDKDGIKTGIWGVMNGTRGAAKNCAFFLPDPWTFSEPAHPATLAPLLALPRYISRNYLKPSKLKSAKLMTAMMRCLIGIIGVGNFVASLGILGKGLLRFGPKHFVFICWFEHLSALSFLKHFERHRPDFATIFLNSIAHLEHHHWKQGTETATPEIKFGLKIIDRLLGRILSAAGEGASIVITNGLTQTNTNTDPTWILYRQIDPFRFISDAGINTTSVEPLMTNDAHLFFTNAGERDNAIEVLSAAHLNGKPFFLVEPDPKIPNKLFYRIDYTDKIKTGVSLDINGRSLPFDRHFQSVVVRTGKHIPEAVALSEKIEMPDKMHNYDISKKILHHFITQKP